jgi:RNA 3'-terminal phosphate cyclase (ATP)
MASMLSIDGSFGEGGGQVIRTSLALSLITGKAFRVYNVRARRERPGLQCQHLTAVTAAAAIGGARVDGAHVGSKEFTFVPGAVQPGEYRFSIGTAGSTMLVLQAVLPPLLNADAPSLLLFEGGTHNVHAPPFEFIRKTFLPLVGRMGPTVSVELQRYGFYPPGGGRFNVYVEPAPALRRLDLVERGAILSERARSSSTSRRTSASASWPSRASSWAGCRISSTSKNRPTPSAPATSSPSTSRAST